MFSTFKIALKALLINKTRSALTILGIVIGIASVILIVSIGKGAENLILNEISSFGSKMIAVAPGKTGEKPGPQNMLEMLTPSLKEKDFFAIKKLSLVARATPEVDTTAVMRYENQEIKRMVYGCHPDFQFMFNFIPQKGRFFTEEEIQKKAKVVVLGKEIADKLFGQANPLNKKIKIKKENYKVIGVLPPIGVKMFFNMDKIAIIPYSTAQQFLAGITYFHGINVEAKDEKSIEKLKENIEDLLRARHNISDPENDDFNLVTQGNAQDMVSMVTGLLSLLLSSIAAISLIVGGIGIMNIMLVSVTERTREIGLRKAIGAKNSDILKQFLFEATILTLFGGLLGIAIGISLAFAGLLLAHFFGYPNWKLIVSPEIIILSFAIAFVIGIIFGLYPAQKAAKLDPIEALRYE